MKKCPSCAEQVQTEALICRYCGHKFKKKPETVARWGLVFIVIMLVAMCTMAVDPDSTRSDTNDQPTIAASDRAKCTKLLKDQVGTGFIIRMPDQNRIDVDDISWAMALADDKRGLLAVLACHAFGKKPDDLSSGEFVVVYGGRSGKRLAMLGSGGFSFE